MKAALLFISLLVPMSVTASIYDDAYNKAKEGGCKNVIQSERDSEVYKCMALMKAASTEELNVITRSLESKLQKIPAIEGENVLDAFLADQKAWELYREKRCAYRVMGTDRGTSLRQSEQDLCIATENYRRIETIKDEPDFP